MILEQKSRRLELAMYGRTTARTGLPHFANLFLARGLCVHRYCLPRALESIWNILSKYGYVRGFKGGEAVYFSLAMGAFMAIYQHEPDDMNSNYRAIATRILGIAQVPFSNNLIVKFDF